jgi:dTDP-4-dehydrorhamnose reductase
MKNRYLILGVNGMTGHMIAQYLSEQGRCVTGFARTQSEVCDTIIGDALCENDINKALDISGCDVVVNAIGILNKAVDRDERTGRYLNARLPHLLAEKLEHKDAKLIHISTDCVFSGDRGKYTEADCPDAVSLYGITKAEGEIMDDKNLTFRTSIVGPELKTNGIGLFHWFMSQKEPVYGYRNVIWSGVTSLQLAKTIMMDEEVHATGLVHLCNNTPISKYSLLKLFNQYCRNCKTEILENIDIVNDKSLVQTRTDVSFDVPDYETMVREMAMWINAHTDLYRQYLEENA